MNDNEIFELAKTFGIGVNKYKMCICWEEEILKFAREMYVKGREMGYWEGYGDGYGESR